MTSLEKIYSQIEEQGIRFISLWFTDITGGVKSITIPVSQLDKTIQNGAHFDGSALESFTRVAESDMLLIPDVNTFSVLPWHPPEERIARLICNVHTTNGDPFIGDPRATLIRLLEQARRLGYVYKTGMELEFFLFDADQQVLKPIDRGGYFDVPNEGAQILNRRMMIALESIGVEVLSAHHENGDGQYEIDFLYNDALMSADRILSARIALKAVARQNGLHCTFMPRPSADLPGSGMHTHQSLHDPQTETNLFYDEDNQYGLSQTAQHFLAGQLHHARAMTAVLSPLVNSYKRLGTSFEAPVYVTWAHINRSALIRVPGGQTASGQHTRLELRSPDPSGNPYLISAVMLQAGLDGIQQQMTLPAPLEETILQQDRVRLRQVEVLPNSLRQALDALEQDEVILSALGPYISDRYMALKRQEYDEYSRQVTAWELERYFNRY